MKLKVYIFCTLYFIYAVSFAQKVNIEILQQGEEYSDSSYYDILPVGENYWIAGKYGTLKSINSEGVLANIAYPSQQTDIYKLDKFDNNNIIACGDKGTLYKYNTQNAIWQTLKIKGYEKSCFYNLVVVNSQTAFICGGNTEIAHSKKAVPMGFILKTEDAGLTWKRVYSNPLKMVWCVKYNKFEDKVYALMYSPNKTHLYAYTNNKWKKDRKIGNSIFHEIQFDDKGEFITTGGHLNKDGRIYGNNLKTIIPNSGLIWGRVSGKIYDIYSASNGQILVSNKNKDFKMHGVKLNKSFNIYETVFTSDHSALAIGSARTILKISISDSVNNRLL